MPSLLRGSSGFEICPVCGKRNLDIIPVGDHERHIVQIKDKRGIEIEFSNNNRVFDSITLLSELYFITHEDNFFSMKIGKLKKLYALVSIMYLKMHFRFLTSSE
jgi:hypothetical protein